MCLQDGLLTVMYWIQIRDFSGNIEGLQMTASSRIHSRTDLNKINETRGKITVGEGDLVVNEKILGRQSHAHHSVYVH